MTMRNQLLGKRLLFVLLAIVVLLPSVQARFQIIHMNELGGYACEQAPRPDLSWPSLYANSYQPQMEKYLESTIGFREWLIRLRNQLDYTLFKVAHTNHVLVGSDRVLYEQSPIQSYLGEDFAGEALLQHRVQQFKTVQDTLARRGKLLIFVAAPSKASFMPEWLPSYYQKEAKRSNYQACAEAMRAAGVNFLDLSRAFRLWKDTASYPLFPRGGIHWSRYGATLAGDTLLRYVEQRYGHAFRSHHPVRGDVTSEPRDTDDDIAKAMNLIWKPAAYQMAYPNTEFAALQPGQRRPNLLLIGDSFCWTLIYPFINEAFDNTQSRFWYYNMEVAWPVERPEGHDVNALDHKQQYLSRDIILVLYTEYNMMKFDSGFSADAYRIFTPYTHIDSVRIQALEKQIRSIPDRGDYWWKKSAELGLSYEQLVHQEAVAKYDSIR